MREFLTKYFSYISDEKMQKKKTEWESMSDEKKQEAIDRTQEMLDNGQADEMLEQAKNGNS